MLIDELNHSVKNNPRDGAISIVLARRRARRAPPKAMREALSPTRLYDLPGRTTYDTRKVAGSAGF